MNKDIDIDRAKGFIVGIVETFLKGPLSLIVITAAVILGLMAVFITPREEEPQIVVPMIDIYVNFPGHSPAEVEELVTRPLEKLLWLTDGVEHVYSISRRDNAIVTVRFFVGEDRERSITRLRDQISSHIDIVPPDVTGWVIKPVEIDDVPIVTLTLFAPKRTPYELRRFGEEMMARMEHLKDISRMEIFGGYQRQVVIKPDIEKLSARHLTFEDINNALKYNNITATAGIIERNGKSMRVLTAPLLKTIDDIKNTIISGSQDKIVRIEDVAEVTDEPEEQENYVTIGFGPASDVTNKIRNKGRLPAVTLAFSKKRGTNAVTVAKNIIEEAARLQKNILPQDVEIKVTRNYGKTANSKVNTLIQNMIFSIISVVGLIAFTMGWREGIVVGLAVPVSFALALFVNYIFGYTINRVTLFALILSLGLVVDDPITNVDNIQRHIRMGVREPFLATLFAVKEVLPPVILSTLAIIISFTPMFFITGMMGPYMGPMAIMVPLTVTFSTVCALTFVPWLSYNLLKKHATIHNTINPSSQISNSSNSEDTVTPEWIKKSYKFVMSPFLNKFTGIILLLTMFILTCLCGALMFFKIPLKMLPFDNKDELQLVLDMPEGTTLEETDKAATELGKYLETVNEVKDFEIYSGINAPVDFNGLVRHYYFRRQPNCADIRINLIDKNKRKQKSHAIALRIRDDLTKIAEKYNAVLSIVEVPPGPPVISTITVEIYGKEDLKYKDLITGAKKLEDAFRLYDPKHIVQIDDMSETLHDRIVFIADKNKLARHGLTVGDITQYLVNAINGSYPGIVHIEHEREPVLLRVRLSLEDRVSITRLGELGIRGRHGNIIQLAELGKFINEREEQPIYHKDMRRVVYVTAECAGRPPGEIILAMIFSVLKKHPLPKGILPEWAGEGEWQITLRVFRDLGIAFGVALIGIYLLMTVQTGSFFMPFMVMLAIPLTIIGIAPGFYILNKIAGTTVAGYENPIFFTATGMIGMIALGGIVIRNSIVLIEFIQDALKQGKPINLAILESGAVRFRPIMLTAVTTMLGAWSITMDPIFSGLAWSLIFGMFASTIFTLIVIPTAYNLFGPKQVLSNL